MPPTSDKSLLLNDDQRLALVDVIDELDVVRSEAEFRACLDGTMQQVLPHGAFACGVAEDFHETEWKPYRQRILLHRYPEEYFESLRQPQGGYNSEAIDRWRATRAPVLADVENSASRWWSDSWIERVKQYNLQNAAMHGFIDIKEKAASFFSFMRIQEQLGEKHVYLLNRLIPHLHVALMRATSANEHTVPGAPAQSEVSFSQRQIEILRWLYYGKSNPEIAQLIGSTEANVKYHLKEIFHKLNTFNRMQAVAKAIELKIIEV